jgi:hypothetical protein
MSFSACWLLASLPLLPFRRSKAASLAAAAVKKKAQEQGALR